MCERSDLSMDNNYKRVGVFGGAFNPPHNGHVAAADTAIRSPSLDKLLVIPTGSSPHKTSQMDLLMGSTDIK